MKKSLLILGLFIGSMAGTKAQCTIQNSCTPTSGYCATPASGGSLPTGQENVPYSTTIQVSLASTYSGITITDGSVTATQGLPSGLTTSTNPSNGDIPGGTDGCILISGTPASGTAGTHPVQIIVMLNTQAGQFPAQLAYSLQISAATGIATASAAQGALYIVPNPAGSQASLLADFHFQYARVFDGLGNLVLTHDANNSATTSLDLSKLTSGIYFVQVTDGNKSVTSKFVKE